MIIEKGLVDVDGKFYRIGEKVVHRKGKYAGDIGVITKVEILEPDEDDFLGEILFSEDNYRFSVFLIEREITVISAPSDLKMLVDVIFGQ